jgi:hypothetical protein
MCIHQNYRQGKRRTEMFPSQLCRNPVAERAAKRRAEWERERLAEVRRQFEAGLLTQAEAKERGL